VLSPAGDLFLGQQDDARVGCVVRQGRGLRVGAIDLSEDEDATPNVSRVQLPFFTSVHGF
jgi:hypothetical protein